MKIFAAAMYALAIAILTAGCATQVPDLRAYQDPRLTNEYKDLLASGAMVDFDGCPSMMFKLGHPKGATESLLHALHPDSGGNFKQQFYDCLGLISRTPAIRIEINGFASPIECTNDCDELSLRRATVVRDALLEMHFPNEQIACVAGHGAGYMLDTKRLNAPMNMRVELWPSGKGCKI